MILFFAGLLCGAVGVVFAGKLRSKPAPWWKASGRSRIKISDLRHDESGDSLLPVDALRIAR